MLDAAQVADARPEVVDASPPDAGTSKIISETVGNRTFEGLTAECDTRGGYIEIHAACAGVNTCAGFSYGDWEPGVLTEHTCAASNGCNGLSCVVLPQDSGKTPQEILQAESLPEYGPQPCMNCHAEWTDHGVDTTKFNVWVVPGSGRDLTNWLDLPRAAQARTVAFGKASLLPDGTAYHGMAPYYKLYARAEIERLVDYIRTSPDLTIVIKEVKTGDLAPKGAGAERRRPRPVR